MKLLITALFLGIALCSESQEIGSFIDSRDGNIYKTVKIGTQTWMAQNLDVNIFRNGDSIPEAISRKEWRDAGKEGKPVWCYYGNNSENRAKYGKLYNWYAVTDPRGLAPVGWHIPSLEEWTKLTDFLGGDKVAGMKMKNTEGWVENCNGFNLNGFSALPGGCRLDKGDFAWIRNAGLFWGSGSSETENAEFLILDCTDVALRANIDKRYGLSIRCLLD